MIFVPHNLKSLAGCTSDHGRYACDGVHLRIRGDEYIAEATDTRILARVSGPTEPRATANNPVGEQLAASPNGGTAAIIPHDAWSRFLTPPKAKASVRHQLGLNATGIVLHQPESGPAIITAGKHTGETSQVETANGIEGRFPPTDAVLPSGRPVARVKFTIDLLRKLLAVAEAVSGDGKVEFQLFDVSEDGQLSQKAVRLLTENAETQQQFTGLIQPASV